MNQTEFILVVFGVLLLIWFINQKRQGFSFFDKVEMMTNTPYPLERDLAEKIQDVILEENQKTQNVIPTFRDDIKTCGNIIDYQNPSNNPFVPDTKRLDWRVEGHNFEEKPITRRINQLKQQGQPIELRKLFNDSVKDYKKILPDKPEEPEKVEMGAVKSVEQNHFSYIDEQKVPEPAYGNIYGFEPNGSSFAKY